MKKVISVFLVLFGYILNAQTVTGIKGGLNIASLTGPGVVDGATSLAAGNVGIFENTLLSSSESLMVEASVSWEGEKFNSLARQSYGYFKFACLNIPILFHKKVIAGLFAETGPQIGFLLSAKSIETSSSFYNGSNPPTITTDYSSNMKSANFGWDFGLSYQLIKSLAIGARYNLGLTNLGTVNGSSAYRSSVFSLNVLVSLMHTR